MKNILWVALATVSIVFASCSSEYHWVKVKSADPDFIVKQDAAPSTINSTSSSLRENPLEGMMTDPPITPLANTVENPKDHGWTALSRMEALKKSQEIVQSFSEERKNDLLSKDLAVRNKAIGLTLHEQLSRLPGFEKLSLNQQNRLENHLESHLENRLNSKVSNRHYARYGRGPLNPLLVLGLIILLGSLLFVSTGSIYAVIGILFAILLIVLGLFS